MLKEHSKTGHKFVRILYVSTICMSSLPRFTVPLNKYSECLNTGQVKFWNGPFYLRLESEKRTWQTDPVFEWFTS
jgi:hypothetical protein